MNRFAPAPLAASPKLHVMRRSNERRQVETRNSQTEILNKHPGCPYLLTPFLVTTFECPDNVS